MSLSCSRAFFSLCFSQSLLAAAPVKLAAAISAPAGVLTRPLKMDLFCRYRLPVLIRDLDLLREPLRDLLR